MTPLLSEALQEAYASASTADVIVDTLEVVAGTQHLYLCRGFVAITLNDENGDPHVFQPVPFEFNLPGQDSTGAQTLNVGIENVDGTVASFVQSALLGNTPIVVKYRSYLPGSSLNPQNPRPLVLTVTAAELTLKGVTFAASVADFVNQPFPNAFYSFTSFPGLR